MHNVGEVGSHMFYVPVVLSFEPSTLRVAFVLELNKRLPQSILNT
jgi:hypothetical protein